MKAQRVYNKSIKIGLKKEVASVKDIYHNFFDEQSQLITDSLKEAETFLGVPKIFIEDPFDECEPLNLYKIVVSLAKLDS